MAKKFSLYLNREQVGAFLGDDDMQKLIDKHTRDIAQRAGEGYVADVKKMGIRYVGTVKPSTPEAYRDNLKNNTLLKALGK